MSPGRHEERIIKTMQLHFRRGFRQQQLTKGAELSHVKNGRPRKLVVGLYLEEVEDLELKPGGGPCGGGADLVQRGLDGPLPHAGWQDAVAP